MVDRLVHSEINSRRIMQVEQCFGSSGQPLAMPDRVLVGEGILTKMCRKKPKPRQFFLFNDILVYGNIVINKKKYNKQHIIPLETVKLQSIQDDGYFRNGWQIISPSKSFSVYAASSTEKSEWMAHINRCVQDLLTKQGKQRSDVEDSPVWVPDSDARVCMNCHKSEFSVLNRKHHCRKCGAVVCGPCSSQKWLLAEQASKPLRVCLNCYEKLKQASGGGGGEVVAEGKGTANNGNLDSSGDSSDDENEADGLATSDQPTFYGGSATKN